MMLHYSGSVPSQVLYNNSYPLNYFHQPLKSDIELAGTFGELRPNHFHSGWDIKTNNQIGYNVFAAQNGFISRIKLSKKGYGLAVYITHPNGFTTVYAHLSKLNDLLNKQLQNELIKQNKDEVDFKLPINKFKIKTGELIALSGNSGGSEAPHLHFEIRDAFTEEAVNPIFFGLNYFDETKPLIKKIALYSIHTSSENSILKTINVSVLENKNELISHEISIHDSMIGIAISGYDKQTLKNKSELGFTRIQLLHFQSNISTIYFDRLVFAENKRINFMIDTIQQKKLNVNWYKLYLPEQNISSFYKNKSSGIIVLKNNKIEKFELIVSDINGNTRRLKFSIKYKPKNK